MIRDTGIPEDDRIYSLDFYEHCCRKVVSTFKKFADISAIYRFGQVTAPGNSDLDFVLVVNKRKNIGNLIKDTLKKQFSPAEQYIVYQHDPMILTEELMPHINLIRTASNLTHLHGKSFRVDNHFSDEVNLIQLIELIIQYSPPMFKANAPEWYRWPLQVINAFEFIRTKAAALGFIDDNPAVADILSQNDKMRSDFRRTSQDQVHRFSIQAFDLLATQVSKTENWLESELYRRYGSWKRCSRNYKVKNIILKNKESQYLNALASRRRMYIHSGAFSPLFFRNDRLPLLIRKDAVRRSAILRAYTKFLYAECNNVGLYRPWHLPYFTAANRLDHYLSNILINIPVGPGMARMVLKSRTVAD